MPSLLIVLMLLFPIPSFAASFTVTGGSWTQFASGTFAGVTDFQLFGPGLAIQDSGSVTGGSGVSSADPIHALTFNQSFSYTSAFTPTAFPGDANPLEGLFEVKGTGSTPPNILPEGRYERPGGPAALTGFFTLDGGSSFHTLSGVGTTTLTFIGEFGTFTSRLEKIHVDFGTLVAVPEPSTWLLFATGLVTVEWYRRKRAPRL